MSFASLKSWASGVKRLSHSLAFAQAYFEYGGAIKSWDEGCHKLGRWS